MAFDVLARAILAGVLFGGLLAAVYWGFRRRDPGAAFQTSMVFLSLFLFMALRYYFMNAP